MSYILALVVTALANVLDVAFYALYLLLILRFVMNFYVEGAGNPGVVFVFRVTEVVLDPIRRKMGVEARAVDLSMIVVFFASIVIQTISVGILRKFASVLGE